MSAKKKVIERKEKPFDGEVLELPLPPMKLDAKIYKEGTGFIPMCGYHNNYADFKSGRTKGTVVFNGNINVAIDGRYSYTLKLSDLIEFCVKQSRAHKRKKKK